LGSDIAAIVKKYKHRFIDPQDQLEAGYITEIYSDFPDYQNTKDINGTKKYYADPLLIAQARRHNLTLLTEEQIKGNAYRLPYISKRYGIKCLDTNSLFIDLGWTFKLAAPQQKPNNALELQIIENIIQ
jgi:Domain of unknown function (DUF4411)